MDKFRFNTYVSFRENQGWDTCIEYLDELEKQGASIPHHTEIHRLKDMYWQSYTLLDPDGDMNPDDNPTVFAIRQFVIQQIDRLLCVETLVHINISMSRPLNSDDEFLIEKLLSKELDANVTITLVEELDKALKRFNKLTQDPDETLKSYQDFLQYLYQVGSETTTEDELLTLYSKTIDISFNGHKIKLAFDAVNYNNLVHLVEQAIKEH